MDKAGNFGSGPTIPVNILYLSSYLKKNGINVQVIDAFSEKPLQRVEYRKKYSRLGLTLEEITGRVDRKSEAIGISTMFCQTHNSTLELISLIREKLPGKKIIVGGSHATAMSGIFLENGADYVILGEGEESLLELLNNLGNGGAIKNIDGIAFMDGGKITTNLKTRFIKSLDKLPFPDFGAINLGSYWSSLDGWGPTGKKYLPLLTSRGCPFGCSYCASPLFWQRRWRFRSPKNVVDEIEYGFKKYGVREFHIEDDNFTLTQSRTVEICKEIARRKLGITFTTPNAIKADTVNGEVLKWMRRAGCTFTNVAPESGSKRVLRMMGKSVNLQHLAGIVRKISRLRISCCAYFILGYPGEKLLDRLKTIAYAGKLARRGLDEIAVFVFTPLPGSEKGNELLSGRESVDWDSQWIAAGTELGIVGSLVGLYAYFYLNQWLFFPQKFLRIMFNIMTNRHQTKTDRTVLRKLGAVKTGIKRAFASRL